MFCPECWLRDFSRSGYAVQTLVPAHPCLRSRRPDNVLAADDPRGAGGRLEPLAFSMLLLGEIGPVETEDRGLLVEHGYRRRIADRSSFTCRLTPALGDGHRASFGLFAEIGCGLSRLVAAVHDSRHDPADAAVLRPPPRRTTPSGPAGPTRRPSSLTRTTCAAPPGMPASSWRAWRRRRLGGPFLLLVMGGGHLSTRRAPTWWQSGWGFCFESSSGPRTRRMRWSCRDRDEDPPRRPAPAVALAADARDWPSPD